MAFTGDIEASDIDAFDCVLWTAVFFNFVLVLPLMAFFGHYERFGGDPQKRSLGNRLISHYILAGMLETIARLAAIIVVR